MNSDYETSENEPQSIDPQMYESVLVAGQMATKSLILINGGAAVSTLAFVGHLATIQSPMLIAFATPLERYVYGVFCAALVAAFTYVSQYFHSRESIGISYWNAKISANFFGYAAQWVAVIAAIVSLGFFLFGSISASQGFADLGSKT
ncbi:MAG: hypothetical protein AAF213_10420 [Pseudomonadota bacterium]